MTHVRLSLAIALASFLGSYAVPSRAQETSVRPGINKQYENPNPDEWAKKWEQESREIYAHRKLIIAAAGIKPGMAVADIGCGTGLFTRLFAAEVGAEGKVYGVDIAKKFVEYVERTGRQAGLKNIVGVVCTEDSAKLEPASVDVVFICDTYHHFEFPSKTMASIHQALRPGGKLVLIDFRRVEGVTKDWIFKHVRAGQEVFSKEVVSSGFKQVEQPEAVNTALKENYLVVFEKTEAPKAKAAEKAGQ